MKKLILLVTLTLLAVSACSQSGLVDRLDQVEQFALSNAWKIDELWADIELIEGDLDTLYSRQAHIAITLPFVKIEEIDRRAIKVWTVYFDFNSIELRGEIKDVLTEIGRCMKARPDCLLAVDGYTCDIGNERDNMTLALNRAHAIKAYLREMYGLRSEAIYISAYGELPGDIERNRKVVVTLYDQ